ncbi:response regulator transcription factor [Paenibacillus glycinis]|uniref:Response regulator n=1 Tax=Paenibacillus glycinis TaxID=2697035 RepID=A0ABW9XRL3_9BACL|nr:response regulator transcription factor [Paenibacillus glycinis]NBD25113.1 response regulator [Paenibacillus glycinis]
MNDKPMIRIVLADDQSIIRQGLRYIIDAQADMTVVGEAADGDEAVLAACNTNADLVLMDIRMPNRTGIEATRSILQARPAMKVVLLTTFDVQEYVFEGIRAGAVGYLLKDADTKELLEGIRSAYRGGAVYSSTTAGKALAQVVEQRQELDREDAQAKVLVEPLTDKELEVLQEMAYGRRNWEIAKRLYVSEGTVKTHVHRILRKLDVEDRTQAVVLAMRCGIVN